MAINLANYRKMCMATFHKSNTHMKKNQPTDYFHWIKIYNKG